MHFSLVALVALAASALAIPTEPPKAPVDELTELFQSVVDNGFLPPPNCPQVKSIPPYSDCQLSSHPTYLQWREMKDLHKSLSTRFAGRLNIRSWNANDKLLAWKHIQQAEYWTVEFGDGCPRQIGIMPIGDLCVVVRIKNAWE